MFVVKNETKGKVRACCSVLTDAAKLALLLWSKNRDCEYAVYDHDELLLLVGG